jgi:hypothetical protein
VAQASAERAELQVSSVEVEVPAEILRLGFEFADTPGIGSAIEVNTAATARFRRWTWLAGRTTSPRVPRLAIARTGP